MESGIKRTQCDYTLAFKLSVVDQIEKGGLTYKEAQRRYGIQGRSTVLVWLRKHGHQRWDTVASSPGMNHSSNFDASKPSTPEQRIKELEVQLKDAQEKAQLFEAVLNVLKKDYGVRVVKKPLGKSSRKSSSKT
jgi:transposase-like protein